MVGPFQTVDAWVVGVAIAMIAVKIPIVERNEVDLVVFITGVRFKTSFCSGKFLSGKDHGSRLLSERKIRPPQPG